MIKKRGIFVFLFLIILFFILLFLLLFSLFKSSLFQEKARRMLPRDAKEVMEFNWDNPGIMPPDYWYALKAKINYEEFEVYRNKMGFISVPKDKWEEFNNWAGMSGIGSWWDPNSESKELYYNPILKDSSKAVMKYENGYLYYRESFGF